MTHRRFRLFYKAHHRNPAVIVEESGNVASGFVITHSPKSGKTLNTKLGRNPKLGDDSPSYMVNRLRTGKIGGEFSTFTLNGYRLSDKDEEMVSRKISANKKGGHSMARMQARVNVPPRRMISQGKRRVNKKKIQPSKKGCG